MRSKNYINFILFFFRTTEFLFLSFRGWKVNAIEELYRSYFFWELYRIEFLFLSFRGWRVNAIEELYRSYLIFFWELYRIEFLFLSFRGSYYLIFFESYKEFIFLSFRGWRVNAIEELYGSYRIEFLLRSKNYIDLILWFFESYTE